MIERSPCRRPRTTTDDESHSPKLDAIKPDPGQRFRYLSFPIRDYTYVFRISVFDDNSRNISISLLTGKTRGSGTKDVSILGEWGTAYIWMRSSYWDGYSCEATTIGRRDSTTPAKRWGFNDNWKGHRRAPKPPPMIHPALLIDKR